MLFALVAGAATALSPCVLPVLPAVLGAGVDRRPAAAARAWSPASSLSFTFATVALVYVIDALGLPDDLLRTIAIVTLLVFGIALLIPGLRRPDRGVRLADRARPGPGRRRRLRLRAVLLGASLGVVYTPCAGPILAGVITVSASQDFTAGKLAVALAYAVGSGAVLYALMLGGRRVGRPPEALPRPGSRRRSGVAMIARRGGDDAPTSTSSSRSAIADDLPSVLVNPSGELEGSDAVSDDLAALSGAHGIGAAEGGAEAAAAGADAARLRRGARLRRHPAVVQHRAARRSRSRELDRRGPVVLIDFWTYTCINCIRTLPYLKAWDERVPRRRPDDRRRARARVRLREGRRQRRRRDRALRHRATRSSRTTSSAPGPRSATSTGRRST